MASLLEKENLVWGNPRSIYPSSPWSREHWQYAPRAWEMRLRDTIRPIPGSTHKDDTNIIKSESFILLYIRHVTDSYIFSVYVAHVYIHIHRTCIDTSPWYFLVWFLYVRTRRYNRSTIENTTESHPPSLLT